MHKLQSYITFSRQSYMILSFLNSHSKLKFFEEQMKAIATLNKKIQKMIDKLYLVIMARLRHIG